jgi:glyoxylase-like metal-dependent hydrolase (beta-lactamase superfamily II)
MKKVHVITVGDIATNCWIYPLGDNPDTCAVIDPGEEGTRIIEFLDKLKLVPAYILLTHGHFDHTGAVASLSAEYRRRQATPEIGIHAGDAAYVGPGSLAIHRWSFAAAGGNPSHLDNVWKESPSPDKILAEGDTVGPFTVLHLPGHTAGSIGLWDKAAGVLFSGDTLFRGDYGRTDLPGGDEAAIIASLKRLFAMDPGIEVYPGHGPVTSIGQEAARGKTLFPQ